MEQNRHALAFRKRIVTGEADSNQAILHRVRSIIVEEIRVLQEHIRGMPNMDVGGQGRSDTSAKT